MTKSDGELYHDSHVDQLYRNPLQILKRPPIWKAKHVDFDLEGMITGEIDLLMFDGKFHAIEVKGTHYQKNKALIQLKKYRDFIQGTHNVDPFLYFVYPIIGGYRVNKYNQKDKIE